MNDSVKIETSKTHYFFVGSRLENENEAIGMAVKIKFLKPYYLINKTTGEINFYCDIYINPEVIEKYIVEKKTFEEIAVLVMNQKEK